DGTYTFTITDSYGDGICCSYGNGSFTWKEGSTTLTSGGSFSSSQTKTFTVGSGSSGGGGGSSSADITVTIRTDNYPSETTWQIRNSSGQTV
ncbi:MAG TPA: peptidase M4 family protein, partial [Cytophagales bacterium]|nr:peptidase M4 family protein [Cytophagales bacterium]